MKFRTLRTANRQLQQQQTTVGVYAPETIDKQFRNLLLEAIGEIQGKPLDPVTLARLVIVADQYALHHDVNLEEQVLQTFAATYPNTPIIAIEN